MFQNSQNENSQIDLPVIDNSNLKKEKKHNKIRVIVIALFFTLSMVLIAFLLLVYTSINFSKLSLLDILITLMPQSGMNPNINILLLGLDALDGVQRSDSIMLIHLDINNNKVGILSIPRDLRVDIPGHGLDKINHAYAFGGEDLSIKSVSNFLQIPIDYYVKVRLDGLIKIIDQLGGVTINVEKRLHYTDKAGNLFINLKPGQQVLNGTQAMGYVRFRHDMTSDFGRMKRQQVFIKAVASKAIESGNIFSTPALFNELRRNCDTDLTTKQLIIFGLKIREAFAAKNVVIDTIPAEPVMITRISYLRPDISGTIKAVDKVINGIANIEVPIISVTTENSKHINGHVIPAATINTSSGGQLISSRTINKILPTLKEVPPGAVLPSDMHLSIEVLNGTTKPSLAKELAHDLKSKGIKVSWVGNAANNNYEKTIIVDWKGMTPEVLQLANSLKINPQNIVTYNKPDKKIDVTLVIGKDWTGFPSQP